jgi:post-segregation antitoxin (ccd killing protein)
VVQTPQQTTPQQATAVVQTPAPSTASPGLTSRACDQNISASQDASCPLAENVFYELWEQSNAEPVANTNQTVDAYSPASQQTFAFTCDADSETLTCVSDSDSSDVVTFSNSAVYDYTQADANAYAKSGSQDDRVRQPISGTCQVG